MDDKFDVISQKKVVGEYELTLATHTLAAVTVDELCCAFEDLLLGHGYRLKGKIEVCNEEA